MDNSLFFQGLMASKDSSGTMSALRRVLSKDSSSTKGLGILASYGVPVSDDAASLPYKAAAVIFASTKPGSVGGGAPNMGAVLKRVRNSNGYEKDHPLDKRFDRMVAAGTLSSLVEHHIRRLLPIIKDQDINYPLLLRDLQQWGEGNAVKNKWIEGYYTP